MSYKKLEKKAIPSWILPRSIILSFIFVLLLIGRYFLIDNFNKFEFIINISSILILIYFLIYTFLFPIIQYKEWAYIITEDKIELKSGIIFFRTVVIPIVKIQHITLSKGPIDRLFNLYKIYIQTASSEHSIPCISEDEAIKIKEFLNEKITFKEKRRLDHDTEQ